MLTRRGLLKGALGLACAGVAFSAYAVGVEPMQSPRVVRQALTPQCWPPGLKLRLVALADIHACDPWMPSDRIAEIVAQTNMLGGDIIVLLGDFIGGSRFALRGGRDIDWAGPLEALRAPLGVHAILGNHDWWHDPDAMQKMEGPTFVHRGLERVGINVLENAAVRIAHGGAAFWLAGLGDQMAFNVAPRRRSRGSPRGTLGWGADDLPATLAALEDSAPAILLAHEPDVFPRVPSRFALTLSGHTHGGQVNLLGWRPAAGSPGSRIYPRGHYRENGRDLIVSSGLGCSFLPLRLGVPPEIMVVELGA
jgi:predicted MPP superfamily phosphohydrolase